MNLGPIRSAIRCLIVAGYELAKWRVERHRMCSLLTIRCSSTCSVALRTQSFLALGFERLFSMRHICTAVPWQLRSLCCFVAYYYAPTEPLIRFCILPRLRLSVATHNLFATSHQQSSLRKLIGF